MEPSGSGEDPTEEPPPSAMPDTASLATHVRTSSFVHAPGVGVATKIWGGRVSRVVRALAASGPSPRQYPRSTVTEENSYVPSPPVKYVSKRIVPRPPPWASFRGLPGHWPLGFHGGAYRTQSSDPARR